MQTTKALIDGLTITGQAKGYYTVDISQGRLYLRNCLVTSRTNACIGIYNSTADPLIQLCTICNSNEGGIVVNAQGKGTIEDCDIFSNTFQGIAISTGGNPLLRRCKIHHGSDSGIYIYE